MTPLPPELRERLRPVVMLFISPIEREARGAIEAIKRPLALYSLSEIDFADHIATPRLPPLRRPRRQDGAYPAVRYQPSSSARSSPPSARMAG